MTGKTFCVTGTLTCSRNEFVKKMEDLGHIFKSTVTRDLDFLVVGDAAGSKAEKARKQGIKTVTEEEALNS